MSQAIGDTAWLAVIAGVSLALSPLACAASTLLKLRKGHAVTSSDASSYLAFAFAVSQTILVFKAREDGLGSSSKFLEQTSNNRLLKVLYAADALYISSIALSRCSSALSLSNGLPYGNRQKMFAHTIAATSLLWLVAATLLTMLRPPLTHPWITYAGSSSLFYRWLGAEVFASILDLAIFGLSIYSTLPSNSASRKQASKHAIILTTVTSTGRLLCITAIVIRLTYLSPDLRIQTSLRLSILSATMLALTHLSTILAFCMGAHPTLKDQERVDSPLSFSDEASPLQPAMKIDGMWPLGGLDGVGNDVAGRRGKWAPGIRPSIREGVNNGRGGRGPHASEGAVYPIRRDLRMEG